MKSAFRWFAWVALSLLTLLLLLPGSGFSADPDTLIIATAQVPSGLDSEYNVQRGSMEAVQSLCDSLVQFGRSTDENGNLYADPNKIEPMLAESWEVSEDGKVITFHMRKGVMSEYGNESTADDVKWFWDRQDALKARGPFFYQVARLRSHEDVEVLDRYTVRFKLMEPSPVFLPVQALHIFLRHFDSEEAKKHATAEDPWATEWLMQNSACYGPYAMTKWVPGQESIFEAREGYWYQPHVKKVIYKEIPSSANRLALLEKGAVDIALDLSKRELESLKGKEGVKVQSWPGNYMDMLIMNFKIPPFDNVKVHQAVAYALPYEGIQQGVFRGYAKPLKGPIPTTYPLRSDDYWVYDTDLDKAKQVLTEAGFPEGFETTLAFNASIPEMEPVAVLVQTNLAKIGIKVNLLKLPASSFTERLQKREFPMVFYEDAPFTPDPGYALSLYYHSASWITYSNYQNAGVDEAIDRMNGEPDPEERVVHIRRAEELIMNDVPNGLLAAPGWHTAAQANIDGITWHASNLLRFSDIMKK